MIQFTCIDRKTIQFAEIGGVIPKKCVGCGYLRTDNKKGCRCVANERAGEQ